MDNYNSSRRVGSHSLKIFKSVFFLVCLSVIFLPSQVMAFSNLCPGTTVPASSCTTCHGAGNPSARNGSCPTNNPTPPGGGGTTQPPSTTPPPASGGMGTGMSGMAGMSGMRGMGGSRGMNRRSGRGMRGSSRGRDDDDDDDDRDDDD